MNADASTDRTPDAAPTRFARISGGLDDLAEQNPIEPGAVRPHLTYGDEGFRVRHLAFDAGAVLPEHSAPLPVVIIVVDGHVVFEVDGVAHELRQGAIVHAGAGVPHVVTAREPSRLVLTLVG